MSSRGAHGFTLIELLTVIAIIGILVALVAVGLSRMVEKAKVARVMNTLNQLRNNLVKYYTDHRECFPPRYGYLKVPPSGGISDEEQYYLQPYTTSIGYFRSMDLYDEFSYSHDTNKDGLIQLLEYSPVGQKVGPNNYEFPVTRFNGPPRPPNGAEANEPRPYVYIPVNCSQAAKVARYYYQLMQSGNRIDVLNGAFARVWPSDDLGLHFPPPRYDAFALIGVGPTENTWGVIPAPVDGEPSEADPVIYHIRALRAFYLATRDANENMKPDFDFSNRTGGNKEDADPASYEARGLPGALCLLPAQRPGPDGALGPAPGPIIHVYGYTQ